MPVALTTSYSKLLPPQSKEQSLVLTFFVCLAVTFCLDLLPGPYAVHYLFDVIHSVGSQALYTGPNLLAHGLFGWDPSRWAGVPAGIAYSPPFGFHSVMLTLLPAWLFYTLQKLVLLTALGFGMYRLLREYAQAPAPAALLLIVPTFLVMSGGQTVVVEAYSFPLIFVWTLDFARRAGSRLMRAAKAVGIVLLFSMTCLVYVLPYFLPLAIVLAFLAPAHADKKRHLAVTTLVWGGYFLMTLPLLWGFLDFLPSVNRLDTPSADFHFPKALLGLVVGYFSCFLSVNILPALYCLPDAWKDGRFRLLFWITAAYTLVVAFLVSPFYEHCLAGTILHKAHIYRAGMILPYCHLILSGYALGLVKKLPRYSWVLAVVAVGLAASDHSEARAIIGAGTIALQILGIRCFVIGQMALRRGLLLGLLVAVFFLVANARLQEQTSDDTHDLYATGFGNHPGLAALAREGGARPIRTASVDLDPSIAKSYGFETLDGKFELTFMRFNDYMREIARPQFKDETAARAYFDNQMLLYVTPPLKAKEQHSHSFNRGLPRRATDFNAGLLFAAGVRYVFSSKEIEGIQDVADLLFVDHGRGLPLVAGTPIDRYYRLPIYAYQLREPLGGAYFVQHAALFATPDETLAALADAGPIGVRTKAFVARSDLFDLVSQAKTSVEALAKGPEAASAPALVLRPTPDEIEVRFEAPGPGLLVVADNFDQKWSATLDGKPVPLLRANYAFQALPVAASGPHLAVLRYRSPVILNLYWASLVGVLCILAVGLIGRRQSGISEIAPTREGGISVALPKLPVSQAWIVILGCTALWMTGFVKFVWLKRPPDARPFWYIAATVPLVSAAVCLLLLHWYNRLRRKG